MTSSCAYYYTKVMSELFLHTPSGTGVSFQAISSMVDFWDIKWYNNQSLGQGSHSFIYLENLLLGLRVRNDSCVVHETSVRTFRAAMMSTLPTRKRSPLLGPSVEQRGHTTHKLGGSSHWRRLTSYSRAGYYLDLPGSRQASAEAVRDLQEGLWLDRGTRVVFIDFSVYKANINLFCVLRLVVEFPATGVKLIRYVSNWDFFIVGCEIIFCIFIFYYVVEEILELHIHRLHYLSSIWNILDLVVILLSIVAVGFHIFQSLEVNRLMGKLLQQPNIYADFEFPAFWQTQYNNMNAVNLFFAWIKIFKYISFNQTMTQLSSTLVRCAKDILSFAAMFFIVFFTYAQPGYLLFRTQVENFSIFIKCMWLQQNPKRLRLRKKWVSDVQKVLHGSEKEIQFKDFTNTLRESQILTFRIVGRNAEIKNLGWSIVSSPPGEWGPEAARAGDGISGEERYMLTKRVIQLETVLEGVTYQVDAMGSRLKMLERRGQLASSVGMGEQGIWEHLQPDPAGWEGGVRPARMRHHSRTGSGAGPGMAAAAEGLQATYPEEPVRDDAAVETAEEAKEPAEADITELCRDMFSKMATYLTGELTATSEDYKLLENMNKLTSLKYLEMKDIAINISRNLKDLNQKYAGLQPYLDQINVIEEQVAALEQAAYKLDAYSKKLGSGAPGDLNVFYQPKDT
ncbi:hypothetical protein MC885_014344, partial [Smutsia gigantea]